MEATDPHCLRPGEGSALLRGHPWRRLVVLGDSVVEGVSEPVPGYRRLAWADRVAQALAVPTPDLAFLNLGQRDLRTKAVHGGQLGPALEFGPDLAMVICGANDALRPGYDPDAIDALVADMVARLAAAGALVVTAGLFLLRAHPGVPPRLAPAFSARMRVLAERMARIGAAHGTVHIGLTGHPAETDPGLLCSDGLHGNDRSHAIAAAETIRALSARLTGSAQVTGRS